MEYDELCKNILELDSKIRFAGVVNTSGVLVTNKNQEGVEQYLKFRGKEPSIDALLEKRGLK